MRLNLITSNIRFDNPDDGEHTWARRKELLAQTLSEHEPDIIGTQEGREPQLREFFDLLPEHSILDSHRDWLDNRMYPSIFYNPAKMEVKSSGDIWLSETPDVPGSSSFQSTFPRLATWGDFFHVQSSLYFFIVNVHLEHTSEDIREKQIEVLLNEIPKKNLNNSPVIFIGDFNSPPTEKVRKKIDTSEFDIYDPWEKLQLKEETSYHHFKGQIDNGSRIDWVLLPTQLECEEIFLEKKSEKGVFPF
jgi:endonuclease/exonuclease/phosphatase family metal-dependent hydrolase